MSRCTKLAPVTVATNSSLLRPSSRDSRAFVRVTCVLRRLRASIVESSSFEWEG